jgi:phytanoyl-CoA hydroxylase
MQEPLARARTGSPGGTHCGKRQGGRKRAGFFHGCSWKRLHSEKLTFISFHQGPQPLQQDRMTTLSERQIASYRKDGFLILPSVLAEGQIEAIKMEILSHLAEVEARRAQDPGYQDISRYRRFAVGLHLKNPGIRAYVQSPIFRAIGLAFVGSDVDLCATSTITKSIHKNKSIDWHQDLAYDKKRDVSQIICWTSVTQSNPENGGLFVYPGSHAMGLVPHEKSEHYQRDLKTIGMDSEKAVPMPMNRGQILVIHPLLVHGSSENKTAEDRIALMSFYRKPIENPTEAEVKTQIGILRAGRENQGQ